MHPLITLFVLLLICICSSCKKDSDASNQPSELVWKQVSDFPASGRQNPVSFVIGSRVFLGLGNQDAPKPAYTDFWEYDATNDKWTSRATFPGTVRLAATSFAINNKGYVANGQCACNDFWEYDPATDKWTQKSDFPLSDVWYTTAFVINNKAYVGTGSYNGDVLNDFWEYDPAVDAWTKIASLPRIGLTVGTGFTLNGKGYVATGMQLAGESKELWEYDPQTDTWDKRADFPYTAFGLVSFVLNDKAYVGLGYGAGSEIWEYSPGDDSWKKHSDFAGGFREVAEAFVVDGTAYIGLGTPAWTVYPQDFWKLSAE